MKGTRERETQTEKCEDFVIFLFSAGQNDTRRTRSSLVMRGGPCYDFCTGRNVTEGEAAVPRSKWAMLILACLMLAGGIFYWQKSDGGEGPGIVHEYPSAVRKAGGKGTAESTLPVIPAGTIASGGEVTGSVEREETVPAGAETVTAVAETGKAAAETADRAGPAETAVPETEGAGGPEWIFATEPLLVNINTADQAELEKLPGIGPAKAAAILRYRAENGPFRTLEDLMRVPGIKEGTFEKIKDHVTL